MKAMILAAGLGSRLKPFTDKHPKALAMVNGKTLLQRNFEYLKSYGISEIIVNVHHFHEQILSILKDYNGWGIDYQISDETDEVLETGGGLKKASPYFLQSQEPFILMNVDVLSDINLIRMIEAHQENKSLATLAVSERETSRYLLFNEQLKLCGWENIKTGEQKIKVPEPKLIRKAFNGLHIIEPSIFEMIEQEGKFSMIDVYLELCASQNIYAYEEINAKFMDVGKPESIERAEKLFK